MRLAIIGGGISGMYAALPYILRQLLNLLSGDGIDRLLALKRPT